jgi:hypothetical protein
VLASLEEAEIAILADSSADEGQVSEIVARAEGEFEEAPADTAQDETAEAAGPVADGGDAVPAGPVAGQDSSSSQAAGEEPSPTPPTEEAAGQERPQNGAEAESAEQPVAEEAEQA